MVVWMNVSFLVCWMPYAVIAICYIFGKELSTMVIALPLMAAKSSVCWNPILYIAMNRQVSNFCEIKYRVIHKHYENQILRLMVDFSESFFFIEFFFATYHLVNLKKCLYYHLLTSKQPFLLKMNMNTPMILIYSYCPWLKNSY